MSTSYSYSRLDTFLTCPAMFRLKYIDHVPEQGDRRMALAGSMAHMFYDRYIQRCVREGVSQCPAATAELCEQVYQDCIADGEVLTLQDWKECIDVLILPWVLKTAVDHTSVMGTEYALAINELGAPASFNAPDAWLRGIADVFMLSGDYAHVIDWKTGWDREQNVLQMDCYALLVFRTFPHVQHVRAEYVMTRFGVSAPKMYSRTADLDNVDARVRAVAERLKAETVFPATPGQHCLTCGVRHKCMAKPEAMPEITSDAEARAAVDMLALYERDMKGLKELLKNWCSEHGVVESNGIEYGFHRKGDMGFRDVRGFIAAAGAAGVDPYEYLRVDGVKSKKLHRLLPDLLEETATVEFGKRRAKYD